MFAVLQLLLIKENKKYYEDTVLNTTDDFTDIHLSLRATFSPHEITFSQVVNFKSNTLASVITIFNGTYQNETAKVHLQVDHFALHQR